MKITNQEGIRKEELIQFLNKIEGNPLITFYAHTGDGYSCETFVVSSVELEDLYIGEEIIKLRD